MKVLDHISSTEVILALIRLPQSLASSSIGSLLLQGPKTSDLGGFQVSLLPSSNSPESTDLGREALPTALLPPEVPITGTVPLLCCVARGTLGTVGRNLLSRLPHPHAGSRAARTLFGFFPDVSQVPSAVRGDSFTVTVDVKTAHWRYGIPWSIPSNQDLWKKFL